MKKSLPFKQFAYAASVFLISRCCGLGEKIILHIDLIKEKVEAEIIIFPITAATENGNEMANILDIKKYLL